MRQRTFLRRAAVNLWADDRNGVLFTIAAGWFLSLGVRLIYPVLLPYLRTAHGFDLTTAGLLLTVLWLAYAIGQLPAGILSDRTGEGVTLLVSTAISGGVLVLVMTAQSTSILFISTVLFGFGTALYGVARLTMLSNIYPENDGAAIGVTMAAGEAGNALLPPIAGFIAGMFTWQYGFGFTIPLFAFVAIGLWMTVPSWTSTSASAVDSFSFDSVRHVLSEVSQPPIVLVTVIQLLGLGIWQAFTGFYPTYLIEVKGLSPTISSGIFGVFFAAGIIVQPVSGHVYDRIGIRYSFPIIMGTFTIAIAAVPLIDGFWFLILLTMLLSSLLGFGAITIAYLTSALPENVRGTGLGLTRSIYLGGSALSPVLFGVIADKGFFDEGFWILAAIAIITIFLSTRLPDQ